MFCTRCGHHLTTIRSGGCGGSGEVAGCCSCDALFHFEGGGFMTSAHPVFQHYGSFKGAFYAEAKSTKPRQIQDSYSKEKHPDLYGKWCWSEPGYGETHYFDTEVEARGWHEVYLKQLHDALPWPSCDKCGVKPQAPYGFGQDFTCRPCGRFWSSSSKKWISSDGEE